MFATAHTPNAQTDEPDDAAVTDLAAAIGSLGLDAVVSPLEQAALAPSTDETRTVVVELDGTTLRLPLVVRAHPTPGDLAGLVEHGPRGAIVVADRLSDAGRDVLRRAGWSWLDRRGHLRLWHPGARIETPVSPAEPRADRRRGGNPWTDVGRELALWSLTHPEVGLSARRVARDLDRGVGSVQELIGRFAGAGLIGRRSRLPVLPELFWETAGHWPDDDWLPLAEPLTVVAPTAAAGTLVRVDERAATLGGARIPAAGDLPARCYVRSSNVLRRLKTHIDRDRPARMYVRESPTRWLPLNPDHPADGDHPWDVAHPIVCALRLATDPARGREVVEGWGVVPGAQPDGEAP